MLLCFGKECQVLPLDRATALRQVDDFCSIEFQAERTTSFVIGAANSLAFPTVLDPNERKGAADSRIGTETDHRTNGSDHGDSGESVAWCLNCQRIEKVRSRKVRVDTATRTATGQF